MSNLLNLLRLRKTAPARAPKSGGGRQAILQTLLENRDGLTADDLAARLSITRSAVHQHLVALERDGFAERRAVAKTKGRPGHVFAITEAGIHQFPKRYDWFSELLLAVLSERLDEKEMRDELASLGRKIGARLRNQSGGARKDAQIETVAGAMSDLGYVARISSGPGEAPEIQAFNCVYHHLATEHPEVCEFDLALLESAMGERPEHVECMVRGGGSCRFRFNMVKPVKE